MRISGERRKKKDTLFEGLMAQNSSFRGGKWTQIHDTQQMLNQVNHTKSTLEYIIIKWSKVLRKWKFESRKKNAICHTWEVFIKLLKELSAEILQARSQRNYLFKVLGEKCQPLMSSPEKLFFWNKSKTKRFQTKAKGIHKQNYLTGNAKES